MPSDNDKEVLCYNKGCGKYFDPKKNLGESCQYHPGAPIFHDAYKSWSCCKKKSTDFTEFLNIKGCTFGEHNPQKPEPERRNVDKSAVNEVIEVRMPKPVVQVIERPTGNLPRVKVDAEISPSLRELMQDMKLGQNENVEVNESGVVPIGTACKNNGCKEFYQGPETDQTECLFHPGTPIFHEGMKYWSCCKRKTSDFDVFLSQKGCEQGKHLWLKSESTSAYRDLRIDWHQTPTTVVISIFAKNYDPDITSVFLTPVKIDIEVYFPGKKWTFEKKIELGGVIDVPQSTARMLPSKIEVILSKAQPGAWPDLYYPGTKSKAIPMKKEVPQKPLTADPSSNDDIVDLSDL